MRHQHVTHIERPCLVAVAHGSRDPRSAATVAELIDRVRRLHPALDARLGFLDLSVPRVETVLSGVARAVVVPLLLGRAYHADVDVPGAVARAPDGHRRVTAVADVLGPDPLLEQAALHRLAEAGVHPGNPEIGVVLAAAGSAHAPANATVAEVAARWARSSGWAGVVPAFACAAAPTVPQAIAQLRDTGARRIAVASWFLAPGLLPDKVARQACEASPGAVLADPLGPDERVARLVADRYAAAQIAARQARSA